MKRYLYQILAVVIPILVYSWVVLGWSVGEDCVAGINGIVPSGIKDYFYCQQQIDTGAYSWQHIPQWRLVAKDWLSGRLPLWNPHQGLGVPLAANFISSAFNPLLVVFNLFGSILITRWYLVFRVALASLGTYLFLYRLTKVKWASLTGAIFFVLSGYFTQFFSMNHHDIDFYLPWMLFFVLLAKERKLFWGVNAFLVALTVFGGMPESTIFVLGFYGLLSVYFIWQEKGKNRLVSLIYFLLSTVMGVAMTAILLFPGFEYVRLSANSRVIGLGDIYSVQAKNMLYWIFPRLVGPFHNILTAKADLGIININYFGVTASLIIIAGLFSKGSRFIKILFLLAISQYFGLIKLPFDWFPVLKGTIYIKYSLGVINLMGAILLTWGLIDWSKRINRKIIFGLFLLITVFGLWFMGQDLLKAIGDVLIWKAKATLGFIALQTTFALALVFLLVKNYKKEKIMALLVILEMIAYTPLLGARLRNISIKTPEFVSWLMEHNDGSRIFSVDGILYPDYASYFSLNDIRNLDALWPANYYNYLKRNIQPDLDMAWMRFSSIKDTPDQREAKILNNKYFDMLAVKYVISANYLDSPQLELRYDKEVKIYQNMKAVDRLRFTSGNGLIKSVSYKEDEILATYSASEAGDLILSDTYYPGWRAEVNGNIVEIKEVDKLFQGVMVPKGNNIIRFFYWPTNFDLAIKISLLGLVGSGSLVFVGWKRKSKND